MELNILETPKLIKSEIVLSGTRADITSKKRSKMFFHFFLLCALPVVQTRFDTEDYKWKLHVSRQLAEMSLFLIA